MLAASRFSDGLQKLPRDPHRIAKSPADEHQLGLQVLDVDASGHRRHVVHLADALHDPVLPVRRAEEALGAQDVKVSRGLDAGLVDGCRVAGCGREHAVPEDRTEDLFELCWAGRTLRLEGKRGKWGEGDADGGDVVEVWRTSRVRVALV